MAPRSCCGFILLSIFITSRFGVVRTCLLLVNRCVTHCPRNMHPYHTRCDEDTLSQRTCDEPYVYNIGFTCGWSRCDCNADLILEEATESCVDVATCSQNKKVRGGRRPPRLGRVSKKIRIKDDDDLIDQI